MEKHKILVGGMKISDMTVECWVTMYYLSKEKIMKEPYKIKMINKILASLTTESVRIKIHASEINGRFVQMRKFERSLNTLVEHKAIIGEDKNYFEIEFA